MGDGFWGEKKNRSNTSQNVILNERTTGGGRLKREEAGARNIKDAGRTWFRPP